MEFQACFRCLRRLLFAGAVLAPGASHFSAQQPSAAAISAFDAYADTVEKRLAQQHRSVGNFIVLRNPHAPDVRNDPAGQLVIERLSPNTNPSVTGSLLHHWRGTMFVPGASPEELESILLDLESYPRTFAPHVLWAKVILRNGERIRACLRLQQRHVIPVVLDTSYDITSHMLDSTHGYLSSRSLTIREVNPESPQVPAPDHGYLWRLNSYWSYEQRDGGLCLQLEVLSLSRSIPRGLSWVIAPYVDSIPREDLEFTLRSVRYALRAHSALPAGFVKENAK